MMMQSLLRYISSCAAALVLSACGTGFDMQGEDPLEYYTKHPIENRVTQKKLTHEMEFTAGNSRLTPDEISDLRRALRDISPEAVRSITINLPAAQVHDEARRAHLSKLLMSMGYQKRDVVFKAASGMNANHASLLVNYAAVVLPRCPDWRTSPITTYSNTKQGNFGCASTVNLGHMVADPNDLVSGEGRISPDSERNATVIEKYRSGEPATAAGGASSAPAATTSSAPTQ